MFCYLSEVWAAELFNFNVSKWVTKNLKPPQTKISKNMIRVGQVSMVAVHRKEPAHFKTLL